MVRKERGQSIVEFAIVLPFLALLIMLMVETAYALRSYLVVTSANREGIRFAARGRYTDEIAAAQIINSAGTVKTDNGLEPFLRTTGSDSNTGIIITHIPILADGTLGPGQVYYTGTVTIQVGQDYSTVPINPSYSRISPQQLADQHAQITVQVNNLRQQEGYDKLDSQIVVVEVFYAHRTMWVSTILPRPFGHIIPIYSRSVMRIVSDARQSQ